MKTIARVVLSFGLLALLCGCATQRPPVKQYVEESAPATTDEGPLTGERDRAAPEQERVALEADRAAREQERVVYDEERAAWWQAERERIARKGEHTRIARQAEDERIARDREQLERARENAERKKAEAAVAREDISESLEYKLAVINARGYVPTDHITVARFRYLLGALQRKTADSKQRISDVSVAAVQKLRNEYGVSAELLDLMEGVNRAIPEGMPMDYAGVVTDYVFLVYIR